ncbi:MAG: sulfotransferase family protein [Casimicrobiaceae bacterium]
MSDAVLPPFPVIVGCPRSGTSLLAVMLDSHPDLAVPPETAFLKYVPGLAGEAESLRQRFIDLVIADRTPLSNWSDFGLDRGAFERRIRALSPFTVAGAARSFYAMYAEMQGKCRTGEKTPDNIFVMRELATLMPEVHYVHVIRDPRDTVLSWRKTWFAPSQDFGALGAAWQQHVAIGRTSGAKLAHYLELRYEDLVLHPETALARVCSFLSLAWSPRMLDFEAQGAARIARLRGRMHVSGRMVAREDRTRIHANLARPPQRDRVGVWRREMSADDRTAVERAASPLFASLGYAR